MKIADKFCSLFGGYDKLVHFLLAMNISLLYSPIKNILINIVGLIIIIILCILKEYIFDNYVDKKDLFFGILGGLIGFFINLIWIVI